jgi:hypothetical protein
MSGEISELELQLTSSIDDLGLLSILASLHLLPLALVLISPRLPLIPLCLGLAFPLDRPLPDHGHAQIPVILLDRVQERFILYGQEDRSVPLCVRRETFGDGSGVGRRWCGHVVEFQLGWVGRSGEYLARWREVVCKYRWFEMMLCTIDGGFFMKLLGGLGFLDVLSSQCSIVSLLLRCVYGCRC